MELKELLSKLDLIEEHARFTLDEFPRHLTKERQRMIIALVHQIRVAHDPEATGKLETQRR
jgi:hypothetical protein